MRRTEARGMVLKGMDGVYPQPSTGEMGGAGVRVQTPDPVGLGLNPHPITH